MVKKLFSIIAIISTIFAALFGFMAVAHVMDGEMAHAACVAMLAENAFCGGLRDSFASLDFHMNFLRGLSAAVFAALLAAGSAIVVATLGNRNKFLIPRGAFSSALRFAPVGSSYGLRQREFLSRYINSPDFA